MNKIKVWEWDLPTRLFHWTMVVLVVACFVTAKVGGNAMRVHAFCGHLLVALITFRIVWGFCGSTYARFFNFVRGPRAILAYLQGRWHGLGHNPLGALSVLMLLFLVGAQAVTGLFATDDISLKGPLYTAVSSSTASRLTSIHRWGEWALYLFVGLHILSLVFYAVFKKKDLVLPMITGYARVEEGSEAKPATGGSLMAFIIACLIAGAVWWVAGGGLLPPPPPPAPVQDLGW